MDTAARGAASAAAGADDAGGQGGAQSTLPPFPSVWDESATNSALIASGFAYVGAVVAVLLFMVVRSATERRLSNTSSRPWLRFMQLVAVSLALRALWLFISGFRLTPSSCLTGFVCAGPIFVTVVNRLSMMLYFSSFALVTAQLLRIGRPVLVEDVPAAADGGGGAGSARGHTSTGRRDVVVFRCDLMFLLLSVWLLVVQMIILGVSLFKRLPDDTANHIYDSYIILVAVLSMILCASTAAACYWCWKELTASAAGHVMERANALGILVPRVVEMVVREQKERQRRRAGGEDADAGGRGAGAHLLAMGTDLTQGLVSAATQVATLGRGDAGTDFAMRVEEEKEEARLMAMGGRADRGLTPGKGGQSDAWGTLALVPPLPDLTGWEPDATLRRPASTLLSHAGVIGMPIDAAVQLLSSGTHQLSRAATAMGLTATLRHARTTISSTRNLLLGPHASATRMEAAPAVVANGGGGGKWRYRTVLLPGGDHSSAAGVPTRTAPGSDMGGMGASTNAAPAGVLRFVPAHAAAPAVQASWHQQGSNLFAATAPTAGGAGGDMEAGDALVEVNGGGGNASVIQSSLQSVPVADDPRLYGAYVRSQLAGMYSSKVQADAAAVARQWAEHQARQQRRRAGAGHPGRASFAAGARKASGASINAGPAGIGNVDARGGYARLGEGDDDRFSALASVLDEEGSDDEDEPRRPGWQWGAWWVACCRRCHSCWRRGPTEAQLLAQALASGHVPAHVAAAVRTPAIVATPPVLVYASSSRGDTVALPRAEGRPVTMSAGAGGGVASSLPAAWTAAGGPAAPSTAGLSGVALEASGGVRAPGGLGAVEEGASDGEEEGGVAPYPPDLVARAEWHANMAALLLRWRWRICIVSAVSSALFIIRSIMFLWRPVTHQLFNDPITYPWLFYTIPEIVPALLTSWLATGASLRVCRRAVNRIWFTVGRPCGCKPAPPAPTFNQPPPSTATIAALLALPDGRGGPDGPTRARLLHALEEFTTVDGDVGGDIATTDAWRHGLELAEAQPGLGDAGSGVAAGGGSSGDGDSVTASMRLQAVVTSGLLDADAEAVAVGSAPPRVPGVPSGAAGMP